MRFDRDHAVAILLSILFPGAGHLYAGRYVMGAVGVVLATWAFILLGVTVLVLNPRGGLGLLLFPAARFTLIGIWAVMLGSILVRDIRFRRMRGDRQTLYAQGYAAYLRGETAAGLAAFSGVRGSVEATLAAHIMAARCQARLGRRRKARSILKGLRRQAPTALWRWEIDRNLAEMADPARAA
ncbi:MAG: hypothetical protein ABIF71_08170 [Planctomycetota bacterium]